MELTQEQKREMYAKQAEARLDRQSTELDLHLKQVQERELLDAIIYVKHSHFVDAMKRVDDKSINKYLSPQNREIAGSISKWNELVKNDTQYVCQPTKYHQNEVSAIPIFARNLRIECFHGFD